MSYPQERSGKDRRKSATECTHCEDHSGRITWERGVTSLLVFCAGLLSYSVLWQAPNIRAEVAAQIAEVKLKNQATDSKIQNLETKTDSMLSRICTLEERK